MGFEPPLSQSPLTPLLWKLPKPPLPFQIKPVPTLTPVNLSLQLQTHPTFHSNPETVLVLPTSMPFFLSFMWMIPAYPPHTASGHHLREAPPPSRSRNHHASSSGLPPGSAHTGSCHGGQGGHSLFSHLFLLLPTGLLEAGDDAHSSIYSQQLGFRQDAGLASFWVGESFEAQDGDKSWPKPQFF